MIDLTESEIDFIVWALGFCVNRIPGSCLPREKGEEVRQQCQSIWPKVAALKEHIDPYQSEAYQKFVESMVPHCHCSERNRPCDGVLAGGVCDRILDPEEPEDDQTLVYDDSEPDDL